jgi:uncharacterized protein YndB with AHSA1/START domain
MTVVTSTKDPAKLTLTIVADFDAAPERVWSVWQDPRKLERWWGPPTFPATFTRHDFVVGGESRYYMTGPGGEKPHGWWRIDELEEPSRLKFINGLAGEDGEPATGVEPMTGVVVLESTDNGTRMTVLTQFLDTEQMETMLGMGMKEGMEQAVGQIDIVLSAAV